MRWSAPAGRAHIDRRTAPVRGGRRTERAARTSTPRGKGATQRPESVSDRRVGQTSSGTQMTSGASVAHARHHSPLIRLTGTRDTPCGLRAAHVFVYPRPAYLHQYHRPTPATLGLPRPVVAQSQHTAALHPPRGVDHIITFAWRHFMTSGFRCGAVGVGGVARTAG